MKSKSKVNYWVDVVIGISLLVSVATGLVFLFAPSGGFQGGRNPGQFRTILGMDRWIWSDIHTWSSVAMAAGAMVHLILHWDWITCMTRKFVSKNRQTRNKVVDCVTPLA